MYHVTSRNYKVNLCLWCICNCCSLCICNPCLTGCNACPAGDPGSDSHCRARFIFSGPAHTRALLPSHKRHIQDFFKTKLRVFYHHIMSKRLQIRVIPYSNTLRRKVQPTHAAFSLSPTIFFIINLAILREMFFCCHKDWIKSEKMGKLDWIDAASGANEKTRAETCFASFTISNAALLCATGLGQIDTQANQNRKPTHFDCWPG